MNKVFLLAITVVVGGCAAPPSLPERPPLSHHIDAVLGPRSSPVEGGVSLGSTGRRLRAERLDRVPGFVGRVHFRHPPYLEGALFRLEVKEEGRSIIFPPLTHQWWPSHVGMEGKAQGLHLVERKYISEDDRAIDLVTVRNESKVDRTLLLQVTSDLRFGEDLRGTLSRADQTSSYTLSAGGFSAGSLQRDVHGAFNPDRSSDVQPRASFTWNSDSMWAPIDGEVMNERRWTCWSSGNPSDWYEVEFAQEREVNRVVLHLVLDRAGISAPAKIRLQYEKGLVLADIPDVQKVFQDGKVLFSFDSIRTEKLRVIFIHEKGAYSGLTELEVFPGGVQKSGVLERSVELSPGESVSFPIEMVWDGTPGSNSSELLSEHLKSYNGWFEEQVPDFECPDPWFVTLWYHRWFLLRKSISDPGTPYLPAPVFLTQKEGVKGWSLDPTSLPFQVREARWLRDPSIAMNSLRAIWKNQYQAAEATYAGQLPILQAHRRLKLALPTWAGRAPWELYLVHPDRTFLEELSSLVSLQVKGLEARGVQSVEEACYLFSVVDALGQSGLPRKGLAQKIRSGSFAEESIERLYPYSFGLVPVGDRRKDENYDLLFDPKHHWAPFPARVHSRISGGEGYSRMQTNVLVLEALAKGIREYSVPSVTRRRFFDFLQRMVHSQFVDGDFRRPSARSVFDSQSGEGLAPSHDLFEAPFSDLLIRFVGGLVPRDDSRLEFFPLVDHFSSFRFRGIPYRGAILDILWDTPDGVDLYSDQVEGYTVKRNGKILFTAPTLRPVFWME